MIYFDLLLQLQCSGDHEVEYVDATSIFVLLTISEIRLVKEVLKCMIEGFACSQLYCLKLT